MSLTTRPVLAVAGLSLLTAVAACGTVSYSQQADNLPLPVFSVHGLLDSVAAASSNDAWAVGYSGTAQDAHTLMFRWDGRTWSRVTSPDVVDGVPGLLSDVTVVSASDAWAAGFTRVVHSSLESAQTLLLHWDGTRWSRVAVQPAVGALSGITTSGHSGWAVGTSGVAGQQQPLILRWDGKRWHRVPAPAGSGGLYLTKVVATSAGAAWASGLVVAQGSRTLHSGLIGWNGSSWQRVAFPIAGPANWLSDMTAGPDGTVWAVGQDTTTTQGIAHAASPPLAIRWTGATWQVVHVPGGKAGFAGVTVAPGGAVWAVGGRDTGTVAMRWTGGAWAEVPVPNGNLPKENGVLLSVAFSSPTYGWAVGSDTIMGTGAHSGAWPLILHWDGTAWN